MQAAVPMEAEPVPISTVNPETGFNWQHGAYSSTGAGAGAARQFIAPQTIK